MKPQSSSCWPQVQVQELSRYCSTEAPGQTILDGGRWSYEMSALQHTWTGLLSGHAVVLGPLPNHASGTMCAGLDWLVGSSMCCTNLYLGTEQYQQKNLIYLLLIETNKQINKPAKQNTIYFPLSHFSNEHHEWVSSFALSLVGVKHCNLSKAAKPIVLPPCLSLSGVFCSNSLHSSLDLTANK